MARSQASSHDEYNQSNQKDEEIGKLLAQPSEDSKDTNKPATSSLSSTGFKVLVLLAVQNASKNLLMRYAVKDKPDFLYSAAVIGSELTKLTLSLLYILLVDRGSLSSILTYLKLDWWNSVLLTIPAGIYNLQQTLEYVALSNLDASIFSVLVQSKLVCTACFALLLMGRKLRKAQVISLVLLTSGVMLANLKPSAPPPPTASNPPAAGADGAGSEGADEAGAEEGVDVNTTLGVAATMGIALASGFAAVYTEKVIKGTKAATFDRAKYSLAYMQVQLASMSLLVMGLWALVLDYDAIASRGLWHNVDGVAVLAIVNSALGGLTVAAVLKFADSVLKGYATAVSVMLTGVCSMLLFGTTLSVNYVLGMLNVVCAVLLYNAKGLDENMC